MIDWQVTATTIFCPAVNDEVTLIITPDGTVKCTGVQKYEIPDKQNAKILKQKSKAVQKPLKCVGENCASTRQYREKIMGEK